jgi:PAS domain S-box-containing protein
VSYHDAASLPGTRLQPSSERLRAHALRELRTLGPACGVGVAYYIGCLAGFAMRFPSSGISFFWPPTAVLAAAFLVSAPRIWTHFLLTAFVAHAIAHAQDGIPIAAWPIQFIGNASQALIATWIVQRYSASATLFGTPRSVLVFIAGGCVLAPAVASLAPAYVYERLDWAASFADAWRARTISNAIASLTIIPSLVMVWTLVRSRPRIGVRRIIEFAALLSAVIAVDLAIGTIQRADTFALSLALYGPAPLLLWATVRFGGAGLAFTLLWTTLMAVYSALHGRGPLAAGTPADAVVGVQLLLTANAVPMMLVAGLLEQNRSERRTLVDLEQQNRAILRALPDLLFLQNREGTWSWSYSRGANRFVPAAPGADASFHEFVPAEITTALSRTDTFNTDAPLVIDYTQMLGGTQRRLEGRFIRVDPDRSLAIIRDITERWESETMLRDTQQRYALATAAGGIGVWELDFATREVRLEGDLLERLGYDRTTVGSRFTDWVSLLNPGDHLDAYAQLEAFLNSTVKTLQAEFRMVHQDGSLRWIAVNGAVTDTVDGRPWRVRGTYTDITERKESARALAQAHDALVRTGRIAAMAACSASIAHELSQPLAAIATNASACLRWINATEPGPAVRLRHALEDVLNDSRRATRIVTRTHAMFSNRPIQKQPLNLNEVVHDILDVVGERLDESRVEVRLAFDNRPLVLADRVQMQQVLLNLVMNAIDAMIDSDYSRSLHVSTRRGRRHAIVSVRDTGKGLDANRTPELFEPFYTTKVDGTGMGLTIGRSIVSSHGGSLWAVANRDRGATFRFRIPLLDSTQTAL